MPTPRVESVRSNNHRNSWTVTLEQNIRGGQRWYSVWRDYDNEWRIRSEHRRGMVSPNGTLGRAIIAAIEAK